MKSLAQNLIAESEFTMDSVRNTTMTTMGSDTIVSYFLARHNTSSNEETIAKRCSLPKTTISSTAKD